MPWFELMATVQGTRVESNVPSLDEIRDHAIRKAYRVSRSDGSTREFPTLLKVLLYLRDDEVESLLADPGPAAVRSPR